MKTLGLCTGQSQVLHYVKTDTCVTQKQTIQTTGELSRAQSYT